MYGNLMTMMMSLVFPPVSRINKGGFSRFTECEIVSGGLVHVHAPFKDALTE